MSTTPPPQGPGDHPLPPGPNPDADTPNGVVPTDKSTQPDSALPVTPPMDSEPHSDTPADEVTDPNLAGAEPTVNDTVSPSAEPPGQQPTNDQPSDSEAFTTALPIDPNEVTIQDQPQGPLPGEIKPGSPYPTDPPSGPPERTAAEGLPHQGQAGGYAGEQPTGVLPDQRADPALFNSYDMPGDQDDAFDGDDLPPYGQDRFGYPDHHPEEPDKTNGLLVLISGILSAVVLAGGGYIWFAQNEAAKTNSQRALEAAQSEAKIAQEEAKKAQEETKRIKAEATKAAEEAAKKASEEAVRAAASKSSTPTPPPPSSATPVPPAKSAPPAKPAPSINPDRPQPLPIPDKGRGKPSGNGCTPGPGVLPDGVWYAYAWEEDDATVAYDLVCLYADGSVTNDSTKVRKLPSEAGWDPGGGLVGFDVMDGVIVHMWDI